MEILRHFAFLVESVARRKFQKRAGKPRRQVIRPHDVPCEIPDDDNVLGRVIREAVPDLVHMLDPHRVHLGPLQPPVDDPFRCKNVRACQEPSVLLLGLLKDRPAMVNEPKGFPGSVCRLMLLTGGGRAAQSKGHLQIFTRVCGHGNPVFLFQGAAVGS